MPNHTPGSTSDHINMIGEGTVVEGTLSTPGDIHIRGRLIGKVEAEGRVVLAQEGVVEGEVVASNADIAGRVEGDVRVETRLILKGTARIEGNIYTNRLVMEEGAVYNGQCEMGRSGLQDSRDIDQSVRREEEA